MPQWHSPAFQNQGRPVLRYKLLNFATYAKWPATASVCLNWADRRDVYRLSWLKALVQPLEPDSQYFLVFRRWS